VSSARRQLLCVAFEMSVFCHHLAQASFGRVKKYILKRTFGFFSDLKNP
jgi:hypothetical protein